MKILVRPDTVNKPISKNNCYFNKIINSSSYSIAGTRELKNLWILDAFNTPSKLPIFATAIIIDLPEIPITTEEFFELYPELLL